MMEVNSDKPAMQPGQAEDARAELYRIFESTESEAAPDQASDTVRGIGVVSSEMASTATPDITPESSLQPAFTGDYLSASNYLRRIGQLIIDQRSRHSRG